MTLRTRVLPALYNGVSQQPPILRSADQTEDELNTWASLADGVGKRPPSEYVAQIAETVSPDAFLHFINRDVTERYIVIIESGLIKVFDAQTGEAKTVNAPGGLSYLASGKFRAVTVADYTFIVNTEKVCEIDTPVAYALSDPDYYLWLNKSYAGADPTTYGYSAVTGQPIQYLPNYGNGTYAGELPSMEKLPETAANGTIYKITGSAETGFISYYVRRNGAVWDETVANGLRNHIKATTMPHCLVRQADGTFTFAPFSWAPRRVGDEQTNPPPTFIGRTIRDVFFYQNRLGLLVDENVVFSGAGDFGNFWRNTILDYIASDVIDVAVTTTNVALLNYALPFNDGVMAFADQTQFSITNGEEGLKPESIAIQPVTRYEVNTNVRPVTIGTEVYYCGNTNGSSVVWEYTRQQEADGLAAAEITAHIPAYLPANLRRLVAAGPSKTLFALTGGPDVYLYQFYWNGNEKLQSAWRKWTFNGDVISAEYVGGYLYILIDRADGVFLEKVHLEARAKPAEQNYQTYLDRRKAFTGTYNSGLDVTTFTFPYEPNQSTFRLIRGKTHPTRPGSLVDPSTYTWENATTLNVPGSEIIPCTGGEAYTMRFTFSRQFPVDYQNRPLTTGRLQLRTFTVYYTETAFFRTEVQRYGTAVAADVEEVVPAKIAEFTGKVIGAESLKLNSPIYHTGQYQFTIMGNAEDSTVTLTNDTHVGSTFVSAEWEGFFFNRAL